MELINEFRRLFTRADGKTISGEIMAFPTQAPYNHPEWTECHVIQHRDTMVCIGFVGRLGYGETWGYDDLSGRSKSKGIVNGRIGEISGRNLAAAKLCEAATL